MFCYKKRRGHFLESEKVFGNFYGTTNQNMTAILRSGKNALLCIDVKGAKTVRRKFPEAVTVFIKAPTMKALEERLKARGTEKKSAMRKRLRTARAEMREEKKYKYVVVNDTLSRAFKQLRKIVLREVSAKSRG
jgi:guanylate kinase